MDFPFGLLAPDQQELTPGAMMQADGVQPLMEGYGPFPSLSVSGTATALSGPPKGLFGYQTADGTWAIAGFTDTDVELKLSDDTWSVIDSGLSLTSGDDWCPVRFGTKLLYTNTTQGMRAYDVESGGAAAAVAAAQKPRFIFECGNILFGLDCLDSSANRDNKLIRSSALSDHTNFTTKGADYQRFESGDALIWGGKLTDTTALILQRRAGRLIEVGGGFGSALWGTKEIFEEFGSVGARSCVNFDGAVYWLATDGFRKFSSAGYERIGAGFVDNWFYSLVDQGNLNLVQACVDPFHKNVLWMWKRASNTSTTVFYDVLGYHWGTSPGKWFTLSFPSGISYLGFSAQTALTWDAVSASVTWDSIDWVWDGRYLQGGQPIFGAMNDTYKFGYFTGANLAATLETAVQDSPTSQRLNWAKPIDDSPDGTLELGVEAELADGITWKTGVAKTATGWAAVQGRGSEIAFRRNITAGSAWNYAKGVDYVGTTRPGPR